MSPIPPAFRRERALSVGVILGATAGAAFPYWLAIDGYGPGAVIGACAGVLTAAALVPCAVAAFRDIGDEDPVATPQEWTGPLKAGGTKAERRMVAEFRERRLLPARTVSATRRRLMAALEATHPASRSLRARVKAALATWRAKAYTAVTRPDKPAPAPKGGRHRAPGGKAVAVAKGTLLHGEPAPEPTGEPEAIAHEDVTELLPALPAAQEDPTGRLFPWATGEFAAFMEAGEPA